MAVDIPTTQGSTKSTTSTLDSKVLIQDKVFEGLVEAISPKKIMAENKDVIDAFINVLTEESPISVNILDIFSKNTNVPSIQNVQTEFAKMYLNNFWYVWNKAKNDYGLKNRLDNILRQYNELNSEKFINSDLSFFDDEASLYTSERYILGKEFKEKKGTATAIEYAYKVAWLAGIEGPLRDSYEFAIKHQACKGFSEGFIIGCNVISDGFSCSDNIGINQYIGQDENGVDVVATRGSINEANGSSTYQTFNSGAPGTPGTSGDPQGDPGTPNNVSNGFTKYINTMMISDSVSTEKPCVPFRYEVEGSLLPEMFEKFVVPLAHPVGFSYLYKKLLHLTFTDYFNLKYIYRADKVSVASL